MKYLLAVLALSVCAVAQSGSFTVPMSAVPNSTDLSASMPPPDPGRTHLHVHVFTTWDQTACVTSTAPVPAFNSYSWTNVQRFRAGGVYLSGMRRSYADVGFIVPAMGSACGSTQSNSDVSIDLSLNTLAILGPLVIESSVGKGVWRGPSGSSVVTTSAATMFVTFEYGP